MIRILIKPVRRLFTRRQQWTWEIRAANGERIDPRDTYYNRGDIFAILNKLHSDPVEVVTYGKGGDVAERVILR